MSSILKALKKAEMESAAQAGSRLPWPAPSAVPSSSKSGRRRWWILTGFIVLVVSGLVYWQVKWSGPPKSAKTAVPALVEDTLAKGSHPDDAVLEKSESSPTRSAVDANAASIDKRKGRYGQLAAMSHETIPQPGALERDEKRSHATNPMTPPSDKSLSHAGVPFEKKGEPLEDTEGAVYTDKPVTDEENPVGGKIADEEAEKTYREDPRITLQALVWAQESASRFVVINNRMIREGGSLDNIVVEKINRDDVLLSEGGNRWYCSFTVR